MSTRFTLNPAVTQQHLGLRFAIEIPAGWHIPHIWKILPILADKSPNPGKQELLHNNSNTQHSWATETLAGTFPIFERFYPILADKIS